MPYLYKRGNVFWISYKFAGVRTRLSCGTRDPEEAQAMLKSLELDDGYRRLRGAANHVREDNYWLWKYLAKSRERAIKRDKDRGRTATLSPADLKAMIDRCDGRCELTGILFSLQTYGDTLRRPFAPSIDRIDNTQPYSGQNCRLILLALNIAINEWGETVFRDIAFNFLAPKGKRVSDVGLRQDTIKDRQPRKRLKSKEHPGSSADRAALS